MSALLPLHHTVAMVTAQYLLDHNDVHSKECRDKAQTIMRQLQSNMYTAVSKDVFEQFVGKYPTELTGELLCAMAPPHLKSLPLKDCQKLLDEGLVTEYQYLSTVLQRCLRLQSLTLDDCNLHSSLDLCASITTHAPGLSSVSLENCLGVKDEMVQSLIRGIPALKYLNLSLIQRITDKVFALEKKPDDSSTPECHLTSVELAGCRQLSSTCIRHLTDLCGPSLQSLNVANTGMDCTILWYLSGYSLSTAGQLAILANKNLQGEDTMQGVQLIELLKDLQNLQQKLLETVAMLENEEEPEKKARCEEASPDGDDVMTSGREVEQDCFPNLEKHSEEEAEEVQDAELVKKDQCAAERFPDVEASGGDLQGQENKNMQDQCKQLIGIIDNVTVLITDKCGQSTSNGQHLAKPDTGEQHLQEGDQNLQEKCNQMLGMIEDTRQLLFAETSDQDEKDVAMADDIEKQMQGQSVNGETNVFVSNVNKDGVSELGSQQDEAIGNILVYSNDLRNDEKESDSKDTLPTPVDMSGANNSDRSEVKLNQVGHCRDAGLDVGTLEYERTTVSVNAGPSLSPHKDGMNEYLMHHLAHGSDEKNQSQDQNYGKEGLHVHNQLNADPGLDEKISNVLQARQDAKSEAHKPVTNVDSDDVTTIAEELVQNVLANSILALQDEAIDTSGLTKSKPASTDVVELDDISLDVNQNDAVRTCSQKYLENSIQPCLPVVESTLSSSSSQKTVSKDVPPNDRHPPDAYTVTYVNHHVVSNTQERTAQSCDQKCDLSTDIPPVPSATQTTMQNENVQSSGTIKGASDQGQSVNARDQSDTKCVLQRLYQPKIMSLDISYIKFDETLARTCLQEFFVANKGVKKLTLSWTELQDSILEIIARASSQLQYLALYECESITSQGLAHILSHCPKLQVLNLQGACFITDFALMPLFMKGERSCVTGLQLSETNITNSGLAYIAKHLGSKLTSLELSWCEEITETGLSDIASKCSSLEVFHARQGKISGDSLVKLTQNCTRLTCLNLSSVDSLTDNVVVEMARNMHHMKVLDLSWNLALTDDSVSAVLCNCPLMTEFNMAGLKRTTEKPLLPIVADFDRWRRCLAVIQLKMRERKVLRETGDPHLSGDEDYEDLYVPVRSTSYVPHLKNLDVEYCDRMKDKVLAQIVAICRGTLTIKDYYGQDIIPKLLEG